MEICIVRIAPCLRKKQNKFRILFGERKLILVNDNWEQIYDLHDVSKIIRENYNEDLADELDKLIPEHTDEEYEGLQDELWEKENRIDDMESEISDLELENEQLQRKIDDLEAQLDK